MNPQQFVNELKALKFENSFNPYVDQCSLCDINGAPMQRAKVLVALLEAATCVEIDALWIGRDLGHRGGRRTGLALTDEAHLQDHAERWGIVIPKVTIGPAVKERTATVIWDLLGMIHRPIFLWNVFPLHPHEAENHFSNRTHNLIERRVGEELLHSLIEMLRPRRIIAIGNDALGAAKRISNIEDVIGVRHPSYGGQTEFTNAIRNLYSCVDSPRQAPLFLL